MNRIALLDLTKKTIKNYNTKIILNKNIAIYGNNCKFNGILFNPQNVYFMDYSDDFMKNNLFKLKSQRMYFTKMFFDYNIYVNLQYLLNTNLNTNIYISHAQYDKFMRRMENSTKYITGESYDNSAQVLPYDFSNMRFIIEEILIEDKYNKIYKKVY